MTRLSEKLETADYFTNDSNQVIQTNKATMINKGRWTSTEKLIFEEAYKQHGKEWKHIASLIKTRTVIQIRTHAQKYFQKLAKQSGGPVMSTSKKERYEYIMRSKGPIAKSNNMNLRKRERNSFSPTQPWKKKVKRTRVSRKRFDSYETVAGSGDDSDFDYISNQVRDFEKKVSSEVVAAATLLLAPRYSAVSSNTLDWARSHIMQIQ